MPSQYKPQNHIVHVEVGPFLGLVLGFEEVAATLPAAYPNPKVGANSTPPWARIQCRSPQA